MSKDNLEQKYIGESQLRDTPKKKLVLRLGEGAVKAHNIADGTITVNKLNSDVTEYIKNLIESIKDWLVNQINGIESGSINFDDGLGNSTDRGINQAGITKIINELKERIDILDGRIIPIYWGTNNVHSNDVGTYYYDPENKILYIMDAETLVDEAGNEYENLKWNPVDTNTNSLYLRADTLSFYIANSIGGALYPYYETEVYRGDMDTFNNLNPDRVNSPLYIVYDYSDNDRGKTDIGTLAVFQSEDNSTVTQLFTTPYIPEEYEEGLYWDEGEPYGDYPRTYYRTFDTNTGNWTGWKELAAHIDIDDNINADSELPVSNKAIAEEFDKVVYKENVDQLFDAASTNPVANNIVTAKFDEIQEALDSEQEIRYFDDYDESASVSYSNVPFVGTGGNIVYMVNDNVFAYRYNHDYYYQWNTTDKEYSSAEYNISEGNTYTIRSDRNFLLLAANNTISTKIDDKLSNTSENAVQNAVITRELNSLKPFVVTVENISKGTNYMAYITPESWSDTEKASYYAEIESAYSKGRNIVFKVANSTYDDEIAEYYLVTRMVSSDVSSIVFEVNGADGDYTFTIDKEASTENLFFSRKSSVSNSDLGNSVIIVNEGSDLNTQEDLRGQINNGNIIQNSDGSIWLYNFDENHTSLGLRRKENIDTGNFKKVENPPLNTLYLKAKSNMLYRWANEKNENNVSINKLVAVSNGNINETLTKVSSLERDIIRLKDRLGTEADEPETSYSIGNNEYINIFSRVSKLEELIGNNNLADLLTLINSKVDNSTLDDYATKTFVTGKIEEWDTTIKNYIDTGLENKADKGHSVVILSYCETLAEFDTGIYITEDTANALKEAMPNGIYWLDPVREVLRKGTVVENTVSGTGYIEWSPIPISEETLYIDKDNKKMYVYTKDASNNNRKKITEIPYLLRQVDIVLEGGLNTDIVNVPYNYSTYEYTPRAYTTNPEGYTVRIKIDDEDYDNSPVSLIVGTHTVTYILDSGYGYEGKQVSYTVQIVQDEEPQEIPFVIAKGNKGVISIADNPENIEVADIKAAYTIPSLYPESLIEENGKLVYRTGVEYTGEPHLYTASEIGLQLGTTDAVGKSNYLKIKEAIEKEDCIGFKLDKQYSVYLEFLYYINTDGTKGSALYSSSSGINPRHYNQPDIIIVLPKDFIIDGEVDGEAVGGLINIHNAQGSLLYTEHSLYLNKVHFSIPQRDTYSIPSIYMNCSNGIDQLQMLECIFDGYGNYSLGSWCVGLYFEDLDPLVTIDNELYIRQDNRINHINIDGCTCRRNLITNFGQSHCIVKSCRITNNTITEVSSFAGILLATNNALIYENKMVYTSCPLWVAGNTISGQHNFCRATSPYYAGILVENSVLYLLHNTVKDFMGALKNGDTLIQAAVYSNYFNGKQLYSANNTEINILVPYLTYQGESGFMKAKSLGWNRGDLITINASETNEDVQIDKANHYSMMPPIRYWKNNKYLLNPSEITVLWQDRTISNNPEIATLESNIDLSQSMNIYLDTEDPKYSKRWKPIKSIICSNNLFNAVWDGSDNYEAKGDVTGNILGSLRSQYWTVLQFEANDNKFIASKISSEEWGPQVGAGSPNIREQSANNTNVFSLRFNNDENPWEVSTSLYICRNDFDITLPEQIRVFNTFYTSSVDNKYQPSTYLFEDNTVSDGSAVAGYYYNGTNYKSGKWAEYSNVD